MQIVQRSGREVGQSLRILELGRAIGTRSIDLPTAWARSHDDVVVAFEDFGAGNWLAHLVSSDGDVLLAFPWHDHADQVLHRWDSREFPIHADEEWTALVDGWWAWVHADGSHVYLAECDGDKLGSIRRARRLQQESPGLVTVDGVEFSWNRVPRVAYERAWQDAIDSCRAGRPSPMGEWISDDPGNRRMRLLG
jgi:hypothetical protein